MALSLDTLSAASRRRWPPLDAARSPPCRPRAPLAMPAQSLSRWSRAAGAQARCASARIARPGWRALFVFAGGAAADGLRRLRDVPGRVGQPHHRAAVGPASRCSRSTSPGSRLPSPARSLGFVALLRRRGACRPLPAALQRADRRRDAGLQRGDGPHLRGARGDAARIDRGHRARRSISTISSSPTSTDPDAWIAEERAFLALRERLGPTARVYYRHRPKNHQPQGRQHRRLRHAAGAAPTSTCSCSTPTA